MCGITGIICYNKAPLAAQTFQQGTAALQHRGPDEQPTLWINPDHSVGLGHCRLSILDLNNRANQPLAYLERYHIVHNGELYNYLELRRTLEQKGYRFYTTSDTEVIVAAFDAYHTACLQQFDGMFAFAIWDEKEQMLFAARDRFGEKPFFFYNNDEQLLFASEMKALWQMGAPKEVNPAMLYNFLTIDYTSNPSNPQETFYKNIYKLPAASYLLLSLPTKELEIRQYWQVFPEIDHTITEQQAIEQLQHLLTASIQKRLRSDVSIGTSLSGGLDSSTIVAYCHKIANQQYSHQAFTASFPGHAYDETASSAFVAQRFGLHQNLVSISPDSIPLLMQTVAHYQEEPFLFSNVLAQYKVYETARQQGITVLLDGQGADEILAGYHKYYPWYWQELYRQGKLKSSGELKAARGLGITQTFGVKRQLASLLPHFGAALQERAKAKRASRFSDLEPSFAWSNKQQLYYALPATMDLQGALYFNTFVYGLEELLRYADRNSMAHGVEVRLPFLSHPLVEFLFTLPSHLKIKNGWTKWILRKATTPLLPAEIAWRKDKVGFETPQKDWMQQAAVANTIYEGKKKLVEHGILHSQALQQKIKPHDAHAADNKDWKYWSASFLFD
jgi:asparagine synthase (glutamine-hydrolysing)